MPHPFARSLGEAPIPSLPPRFFRPRPQPRQARHGGPAELRQELWAQRAGGEGGRGRQHRVVAGGRVALPNGKGQREKQEATCC